MDDEKLAELIGFKQAARGQVALETRRMNIQFADGIRIGEIDNRAIEAHEYWHPNPHDFGWNRILKWKGRHLTHDYASLTH